MKQTPHRIQSRGFSKPPERIRLRDMEREPQKLSGGFTYSSAQTLVSVPKENASQSGPYMTAAKSLGYCMRCGVQVPPLTGLLDFAHADMGKGQGLKTDVRRGWPACRACHEEVGRKLSKPVRRAIEYLLGVMTRAAVLAADLWPKNLPEWIES